MRTAALVRVVVAIVAVLGVWPAAASGAGWSLQDGANVTPSYSGTMHGLDCASASSCVAVGTQAQRDNAHRTLVETWDGTSWTIQPAPSPSGTTSAELQDVACPAPDACLAVGWFRDSEENDHPLLERWDGTSWTIQPAPLQSGAVSSISCTSTTACTAVGSAPIRWDGSTWSVQTAASPAGSRGLGLTGVSCVSATDCTATGHYLDSGTSWRTLAEHWDGTSWTLLPTEEPNGSWQAELRDVSCTSATDCTAVGDFITNAQLTLVERWDGTRWTIQPSPNRSGTESGNRLWGVSCASATACVAVGEPGLIEQWDGTSWTIQTSLDVSLLRAVHAVACTSPAACTAVGQGVAARWDGASWTSQEVPRIPVEFDTDLAGISCTSRSACLAVGSYDNVEHGRRTLVVKRWDGTVWTQDAAVADPSYGFGSAMKDVSCTSPSACLAVGNTDFTDRGGTSHLAFADRYDGTTWTSLPYPKPYTSERSDFTGVSCASATWCVAVGHYAPLGGVDTTLIERWDATGWTELSSPAPAGTELSSVSCTSTSACVAVGSAGVAPLAERWNGSSWSVETTPLPPAAGSARFSSVSCSSATSCTAVGQAGAQALAERWDGTTWSLQPTPVPSGAKASALTGVSCRTPAACTATGYVEDAASTRTPLAVRWDGKRWALQPVPNPAGAQSAAFSAVSCPSPTACDAVGNFTKAGDENLAFAAGWSG